MRSKSLIMLGMAEFLLVAVFGIAATVPYRPVRAEMTTQQGLTWSKPVRLSSPGGFAFVPFIVADQEGNLHAVWSENDSDPIKEDLRLDTIYYAVKRGARWSTPADVFAAPAGGQALVTRMRVNSRGELQMLWVTRSNLGLFFATASASNATSAKSWHTTRIPEAAWIADFASSMDGKLHLVYALERQGIYYRQSTDGGANWSAPVSLWLAPGPSYSPANVRVETDGNGALHVAWSIASASPNWGPYAISYARSIDDGRTWQIALTVNERDNHPNIGFDRSGGVHLVWDNPADSMAGRGHSWSIDGGRTWKRTERIFLNYRGQTWWPVFANDSSGTLYLIFAADTPTSGSPQVSISVWRDNNWGAPQVISGSLYGGEGPSVAVSEGNKLHVVWFSYNEKEYGIWYTMAQTSASPIAPQPVPTAPDNARSQPTLTRTRLPPLSSVAKPATPVPNLSSEIPANVSESPVFPIAVGAAPVALIMAFMLMRTVSSGRR